MFLFWRSSPLEQGWMIGEGLGKASDACAIARASGGSRENVMMPDYPEPPVKSVDE
jgi:hypothetical protein